MPKVHVVDVPEFSGLVESAKRQDDLHVSDVRKGYVTISGEGELVFDRRDCGFKPALWYTCLSGGLDGAIIEYGRDTLRIGAQAEE